MIQWISIMGTASSTPTEAVRPDIKTKNNSQSHRKRARMPTRFSCHRLRIQAPCPRHLWIGSLSGEIRGSPRLIPE